MKRSRTIVGTAVVVVLLAACASNSTTHHAGAPATGAHSTPPASGVVTTPTTSTAGKLVKLCLSPSAALAIPPTTPRHRLPEGTSFFVLADEQDLAFGQYQTASGMGVGIVDLTTGRFTSAATLGANASGVGSLSVALPWVVWEQEDSATDIGRWSVWAWNHDTRKLTQLSTGRRADGSEIPGSGPVPLVVGGHAFFAQPQTSNTPQSVMSDFRDVDLSTGHVRVVASGVLSSPVLAGSWIIWASAAATGDTWGQLHALDSRTRQPVALPTALRSPGPVADMVGNANAIGWTTTQLDALTIRDLTGNPTAAVQAIPDAARQFQFLQLQGTRLLWASPSGYALADTATGVTQVLPLYSSGLLTPQGLLVTEPIRAPTTKGGRFTSQLAEIPWPQLPNPAHC
jgi:hypothetical protein